MLTLRPIKIGPPVYAHLADYEVMEDGRSIGSIKQEREEEPRNPERAWSWSLTIVGARLAGIKTSGYGPSLEDVKARLCRLMGRLAQGCRTARRHPDGGAQGLGFRFPLTYIAAMLRLRKRPPSALPTVNAGEPWSEFDLCDLEDLLLQQRSIPQIAEFLCRTEEEVEAKIASVKR
jgi:hypothetical protein